MWGGNKLHEEGKYARESARNYGDRVRCVLLSVLAFLPPQHLTIPAVHDCAVHHPRWYGIYGGGWVPDSFIVRDSSKSVKNM